MSGHKNSKEMSQGQDAKKTEGTEELPKQVNVTPDAPSESSKEEVDDERRLIQAFMANPEDESNFLEEMKAKIKADSKCKCTECGEEHDDLEGMHEHLLCHSNCKFYFCVQCFEGCETLTEMVLHRKTHGAARIDSGILRKLRSPEGLEPPQSPMSEELEGCPPEKRRRIEYRCTVCGSTFDRLDVLLSHTEQQHPTERDIIDRLRVRLMRAALSPYAVEEEEDASDPTR